MKQRDNLMQSARVRDFHSNWWNIWNRTSEHSDGVRFWYVLYQRVWKFRTKCFPCCNLFELWTTRVRVWTTKQLEYSNNIILSKLPDKANRDDREKPRENTICLRHGFWLDETIFFTCEKLIWPLWLVDVKSETLFHTAKIWRENLSMFNINYHSSHWPRRIILDLKSQAALQLSIAKIIWFPN